MNDQNQPLPRRKLSFWNTTLGVITKITALVSAITALILAVSPYLKKTDKSAGSSTQEVDRNTKKSHVMLSAFSIQQNELTLDEDAKPKTFDAIVEAYNAGDSIALGCSIDLVPDEGRLSNASTPSFSLNPNEKKSFTLQPLVGRTCKITAQLHSESDPTQESQPIPITVWLYGQMHTKVRD